MNEPTQHFADVPLLEGEGTHRIAYYEWGDQDAPVVICVHGLTRNARDFDFLAREMAATHRVIAVDMAGRGTSEWLQDWQNYNYMAYMMDCLSLLEHLQLEQVKWVGTSMGGIIGMMVAALHPGRISKLVLNDIGSFIPKAGLERIIEYVNMPVTFDTHEKAEAYLREVFAGFGLQNEAEWNHLITHSLIERNGTWQRTYDPNILMPLKAETDNFTKISDVDLGELWEAIDIPVMLLHGEMSDLLTQDTADAMAARDHVSYHRFANIGHAPSLFNAEQVSLVADWLRQ